MEGRDVWVNSGKLQTGQDQFLPHQTHSRGRYSQLSGRLRYTHSGVDYGEASPQHHRLNTQCKIHENWLKGFLFITQVARSEYMHLKLSNLPESVVQNYNLVEKPTSDSYVYVEIKRGMYGLPQAGLIVQQLL